MLLIALPLVVFISGCVYLRRTWTGSPEIRQAASHMLSSVRAHLATLLIAIATLTAYCIHAVVALHLIAG